MDLESVRAQAKFHSQVTPFLRILIIMEETFLMEISIWKIIELINFSMISIWKKLTDGEIDIRNTHWIINDGFQQLIWD